jgi:exoribonuclease-2
MLPLPISAGATSLLEGEDRLAVVVALTIAPDGDVTHTTVSRAQVHNHAKLDYDDVGAWLEDETSTHLPQLQRLPGLAEQLRLQNEAAQRLQSARERSGALELESRDAAPVMQNGRVVDLRVPRKNPARKLIENLMVATNMAMAQFLEEHGSVALGRVVHEPQRWPRIRDIAAQLGDELPAEPDAYALSQFLRRRKAADPEHYPDLSLSVVKLLGPGEYTALTPGDNAEGHFGLGAARYMHSTAPNRRYADLTTQRLLKSVVAKAPAPYSLQELQQIAARCNDREAAAQKVERTMRKVAAAALFGDRWVKRLRPLSRVRRRKACGCAPCNHRWKDASCVGKEAWMSVIEYSFA